MNTAADYFSRLGTNPIREMILKIHDVSTQTNESTIELTGRAQEYQNFVTLVTSNNRLHNSYGNENERKINAQT